MAARVLYRLQHILKQSECRGSTLNSLLPYFGRSFYSSVFNIHEAKIYNEKDPGPYFFDAKVQNILKRLTGADYNKVFRTRKFGTDPKPPRFTGSDEEILLKKKPTYLRTPKYKFLTNEELNTEVEYAKRRANKLLQMPPVIKEREPINEVLSRDPALKGYDSAKIIFTDITLGVSDRKRVIVVRDPDGTLRSASWEEREHMNQIYNPRPGRKLREPQMFEDENLKDVISREEFEFILERACAQFEPDDPVYQKVSSLVYEAVDQKCKYEKLHSTRHYGPMCFYLAWHKKMDNLLINYVQQEKLPDCVDLIQLYHRIHRDSDSAIQDIDSNDHMNFVKMYVQEESLRQPQLQLAIQRYEDLLHERQEYKEIVQKSHGL